jgi:hypothetical protein
MADTVRFALTYEPGGAGPASIVGKFASQDEQSLNTGRIMRAYEVEVRFYAEVAPRVAARVPRLLFAALDPAESWFTLLLEDLGHATQGDEIEGCGADVAVAALGQLAALHAPCWEDPTLAATPWIDRSSPEGDEFTLALVTGLFPGFLERFGDRLASEHRALLEAFIPRMGTWMSRERGPRTFVGGSLEPEVRRASGEDLVAGYHEALVARGVVDYPLERLRTDYRAECFGGLLMAVGASMVVKQTERGDRMFVTNVRRHAQQALDLDALALLADD